MIKMFLPIEEGDLPVGDGSLCTYRIYSIRRRPRINAAAETRNTKERRPRIDASMVRRLFEEQNLKSKLITKNEQV